MTTPCIGLLEPFYEARHGAGADRDMPTEGRIGRAELARMNRGSRTIRLRDAEEIVGMMKGLERIRFTCSGSRSV